MFIQLPINKFILEDNKLFINESVIEYENISDESKEILESLISKGAYFSSLLELNSNYNVKTINEKEITSEDYTKYLQECKSLKKECIVETTALNYKPLVNIRGLEIMENDTSIARGKNNKLFIEDFRLKEDASGDWLKFQNQIEQIFENAKSQMDEEMFYDFCDAVGDIARNYSFGYNEDEELQEEAEGTQTDDIADKVDYEVGSLQKPKKPNHIVEMFNVPSTHTFKGFMMNEQGVYARGNYILINESGKIKAVNKKLYEEELNAYGELIIPIDELDTRASELVKELNTVFNEYAEDDPLYDFGFRMEEDGVKIFDKNECFDYESKEFRDGSIDKIVKDYFGPKAYLEPDNSVIFTIAGIDTDVDEYNKMVSSFK